MRNRDATKLGRLARAQHAMEGQVFWKTLDDLLSVVHAPRGAKPRDRIHTGYLSRRLGDQLPRVDKSLKRQCFEKVWIGPHFSYEFEESGNQKSAAVDRQSKRAGAHTAESHRTRSSSQKCASAAPPRRTLYRFSSTDVETKVPYSPKKERPDPRFIAALKALHAEKFWTDTPNPYQIKVGRFNYYWTTGKITIDGAPRVYEKGLDAFIRLLKDDRDGKRRPTPDAHATSNQGMHALASSNSNDDEADEPTEFRISGLTYEDPPAEVQFVFRGFIEEPPTADGDHNDPANDRPF